MEEEEKRLKMAIIAGAAHAARYMERYPRADEQDVIKHITENVQDILRKIDNPL